jgi:hypothetical protein
MLVGVVWSLLKGNTMDYDTQEQGNGGSGYFKAYASEVYPEAKWTGGSGIHASRAVALVAPIPFSETRLILKSIRDTEFIGYIARVINKTTPGVEWLMAAEDFQNLLLLDFNRLMNGMPTTETKNRLQNPSTGNVFHRVTLNEDKNIVGGLRVWVEGTTFYSEGMSLPGVQIGFRYRLERIVPEGTATEDVALKIREKAQQQILELTEESANLKEYISEEAAVPVMLEQYVKEQF